MRTLPAREVYREEANCVRWVPIFSGLTPEQQDLVATRARSMHVSRGDVLHVAGERSSSMYVVHTGQIKLSRTTPSGWNRLLRVAQPGETVGEHTFLSGGTTVDEAEALSDVQLCEFVHQDFAALVEEYPDIGMRMMRTLGERLAQAERDLALGMLSVDARLADFLLQQPACHGQSGDPTPHAETDPGGSMTLQVALPLSKKDIASLLGTTPESLSRALARFTAHGFIRVNGGLVTLLDPQALEDRLG